MALVERYHSQEVKAEARTEDGQPAGVHPRQAVSLVQSTERAHHVGILAIEVYFPNVYVCQEELEAHDGVQPGKYTVGLGQRCMAFCGDQEDVVSMGLTAVHCLLEKYDVDPKSIGRLEVGTESALDRSKSIKTFLMTLFAEHGNYDVEGVDSLNACYGGTAALFNAVNWVESRAWDGRLALVVAADIAMYAAGPARPSGGCGAVAILVGPDAPLDLERGLCASHMEHAYDFYKPCGFYPLVDGKSSVACYLMALDRCYASLCEKFERQRRRAASANGAGPSAAEAKISTSGFNLADADFAVLHSPFVKMVRKGFARLVYQDHLRALARRTAIIKDRANKASDASDASDGLPRRLLVRRSSSSGSTPSQEPRPLRVAPDEGGGACSGERALTAADVLVAEVPAPLPVSSHGASLDAWPANPEAFPPESYTDRDLERAAVGASAAAFQAMVTPGLLVASECGNMYAASVHAGLASLMEREGTALEGRRILLYSYGSGLAASLWSVIARRVAGKFGLAAVSAKLDLAGRLRARRRATPAEFVATLELQERRYKEAGFQPSSPVEELRPGTYYLCEVDSLYRRTYARKPL